MSTQTSSLSPPRSVAQQIARRLIVTARNNFVERPWGGMQLRRLKSLCPLPDQVAVTGSGLGESFEIAAFDDDAEAARYASKLVDDAGSKWSLPELIRAHGELLLGETWIGKYGHCIPLLPKFLNVRELLSVQGHPAGHTEAYIVVDAEPGATIRLGFRNAIDPAEFSNVLVQGQKKQVEFADLLGEGADWFALQRLLSAWFADVHSDAASVVSEIFDVSGVTQSRNAASKVSALIEHLKQTYWYVLDSMNEIELVPGQVIHNSTPARLLAGENQMPAAEVHALGNPQQKEFMMLEVRRPGPTLRAWDNVRFPMREVDLAGALEVLNLSPTSPGDFICSDSESDASQHHISVDSPFFRVEHVNLSVGTSFESEGGDPHCLHVLHGAVAISTNDSADETLLSAGESAFVPFGVRRWRAECRDEALCMVKVHLP